MTNFKKYHLTIYIVCFVLIYASLMGIYAIESKEMDQRENNIVIHHHTNRQINVNTTGDYTICLTINGWPVEVCKPMRDWLVK